MNTKELISLLDSGAPAIDGAGFLGVDIPAEDAGCVIISVPWDATTSYGQGAAEGPEAVIAASHQLDTFDLLLGKPFRAGITVTKPDPEIVELNKIALLGAKKSREASGTGIQKLQAEVNATGKTINGAVWSQSRRWLEKDKIVGVLGGDHSSPLGLIQALAEKYPDGFGILHIDAHHDLRDAYEGFEFSHASIFYNVMEQVPAVTKLVQVGIRDFSSDEKHYADMKKPRIKTFYDREIFQDQARGVTFAETAGQIMDELPENIYISFDIDGLDPMNCPSTGTPVPGGLSFHQACFLLETLAVRGKKIIGFDLCEVAPDPEGKSEWDANVGARMLYKLCAAAIYSKFGSML